MVDLFNRANLLHHKRLEAKSRISRLDGILVGAKNAGDPVTLDQHELAFVVEECFQLPLVGLLFFFEYHCPNNRIRN
jgi:hypothetical protein